MSRRYENELRGHGGNRRHGGRPPYPDHHRNSWYVYWHPWYGYTWYFPCSWWYPWGGCYYPSYYYRGHRWSFGFCIGLSGWWDWSFCGSWYYPSCYSRRYWYYPYYACSLGYPYYRYVYVGSGPSNEYTTVYNYYFGSEDEAWGPAEAEAMAAVPAVEAAADGGGSGGLPEAAPPAPARVLSGAEYFLRLGDEAFLTGRYAKAMEAYQQAAESDPESAVARFALAEAVMATGDYHQAAYMIREGLKRDPRWPESDLDRRSLYGDPAAFERVREQLDRYVEANPYDASAHFVRGYARFFSGDRKGARESFGEVLRLQKEDADAAAFLRALDAPEAKEVRGDGVTPERENA